MTSRPLAHNSTSKWLHWSVGTIAIIMLVFGSGLDSLPIDQRQQIIMGHSGLGTLVLLLMVIRSRWRLKNLPPGPTSNMKRWQILASNWMHWSLYSLLLAQPIFGILQAMYITEYEIVAFGLINYSDLATDNQAKAQIFHILHGVNATVLSILVLIHIFAAFYHHLIQKDDVLRRMLPLGKVRKNDIS